MPAPAETYGFTGGARLGRLAAGPTAVELGARKGGMAPANPIAGEPVPYKVGYDGGALGMVGPLLEALSGVLHAGTPVQAADESDGNGTWALERTERAELLAPAAGPSVVDPDGGGKAAAGGANCAVAPLGGPTLSAAWPRAMDVIPRANPKSIAPGPQTQQSRQRHRNRISWSPVIRGFQSQLYFRYPHASGTHRAPPWGDIAGGARFGGGLLPCGKHDRYHHASLDWLGWVKSTQLTVFVHAA